MKAMYGFKIGMTRVFDDIGNMVPVTAIKVEPHTVIGIKTNKNDGYTAIELGFTKVRNKLINKPHVGQFKKAGIEPCRYIREVRVESVDDYKVGDRLEVGLFSAGDEVSVTGISKGLGFQGTVRRHGFKGGPKTHGQSDRLRAPGSIGQSSYPSRVWKGMKMSGHMGNERVTVRNLLVNSVEPEHDLILVRGAVPGKPGGLLKIIRI